jgi:hypothetical protein
MMRRFAALLVVMLTLPASGCMMKPRHLPLPRTRTEFATIPAMTGTSPNGDGGLVVPGGLF